jgi:anti-sigma-K factor RskA
MSEMEQHELVAPYALGALDDHERREFERHLEQCERCRKVLPSFADAASALAFAASPVTPAPELRSRILGSARRGGAIVQLRRRAVPSLAAAAAVAAAAAIGLGIWAASLHSSLSNERDVRAAEESALAVLADPAARRVSLSGRPGLLAVRADGTAALAIRELARAPAGKTYEAWVIVDAAPRRAGLFRGGTEGATLFVLERRVPRGAGVAVTIERAAGAERPTGEPILSARL